MKPATLTSNRKLLLSLNSVAEILDVPKSTLYDWVRRGLIDSPVKIGRHTYWKSTYIEAWVNQQFSPKPTRGRPRSAVEHI